MVLQGKTVLSSVRELHSSQSTRTVTVLRYGTCQKLCLHTSICLVASSQHCSFKTATKGYRDDSMVKNKYCSLLTEDPRWILRPHVRQLVPTCLESSNTLSGLHGQTTYMHNPCPLNTHTYIHNFKMIMIKYYKTIQRHCKCILNLFQVTYFSTRDSSLQITHSTIIGVPA